MGSDPLPLDLNALGRALAYASTIVLLGACAFLALVPRWRGERDDDQSLAARSAAAAWRTAFGAAGVLPVAHLVRAWGQVRDFIAPDPMTWAAARPMLLESAWGRGWMIQLVVATLAVGVAGYAPRRPVPGLASLAAAALAVAAASPLTGHAVEHPWNPGLGIGLHALHLIGGGAWLGALFTMVVAGLRVARGADAHDVARMVRAFSPVALAGAGTAVGAGLLLALAYVGTPRDLIGTSYGRVLIAKSMMLAAAMALGALNWRRLSPRLGDESATLAMRRSASLELAFGAGIVAATALLVSLPAPRI